MSFNSNFKKDFNLDYQREITQAVNNMIKKYLPLGYRLDHVWKIEEIIMGSIYEGCIGEEYNELYRQVQFKQDWFVRNSEIVSQIKKKVSMRKCNDCEKAWIDCRNTCIKPKTNPRPIEFPKDVFNVIKDYLGVYDIPEPITELMGMMKLQNLKDEVMMTKGVSYVGIKDRKSLSIDERLSLYKSKIVWDAKNRDDNVDLVEKKEFLLRTANKYPQLRFGKELTDMNKIFLMDLLFAHNYMGTCDQGDKQYTSLFDFMRGESGLSKFKKTPKNPKPYVMYFDRMYFGEEYSVRNFTYDMRDFYNSMDKSDYRKMEFACDWYD